MAESKHTPGPWEYRRIGSGIRYVGTYHHAKILATVEGLADGVDNDARDREANANARLIAAAPRLLEICNNAKGVDPQDGIFLDDLNYRLEETAIAKAKRKA